MLGCSRRGNETETGALAGLFQVEQHRGELSAMSESHPVEAPLPLQVCSERGPQDP